MQEDSKIIVVHAEFKKLRTAIAESQKRLGELILKKDELEFHICKEIEAEYLLKFGGLKYKIFKLECDVLRKKRKLSLIQVQLNRQEAVNLKKIEEILEQEFEEYQEELKKKLEEIQEAIDRRNGDYLTEEESKEAKKLYYEIAKILHPDLHPNLPAEKLALFQRAITSYKTGDIVSLRVIASILDTEETWESENSFQILKKEEKRLEDLLLLLEEGIRGIKGQVPYIWKALVENEKESQKYEEELKQRLENLENLAKEYDVTIEETLRGEI